MLSIIPVTATKIYCRVYQPGDPTDPGGPVFPVDPGRPKEPVPPARSHHLS